MCVGAAAFLSASTLLTGASPARHRATRWPALPITPHNRVRPEARHNTQALRSTAVAGRRYGGNHRRYCRPAAGHRLRDCERGDARAWALHCHRGWISHFGTGRFQGSDRRTHGRLCGDRLRHRAAVWDSGTHRRDADVRCHPAGDGICPPRHNDQVHSAAPRYRIHQRDRRHHPNRTTEGLFRPSHGCRPAGIHRKDCRLRLQRDFVHARRARRRGRGAGHRGGMAADQSPPSLAIRGAHRDHRRRAVVAPAG